MRRSIRRMNVPLYVPPALMIRSRFLCIAACVALTACSPKTPPDVSCQPKSTPAGFVDKVWITSADNSIEPGMRYAFLGDGTLVVTSPNTKPALGSWTFQDSVLTMVEEGIAYRADVLQLSHDRFRIRSNHPGGSLEIDWVTGR
ncbi:MAG: hypothetical protein ACT4PZ_23120 [Panacagrimonas sp.]